jgi:hypothetical protein
VNENAERVSANQPAISQSRIDRCQTNGAKRGNRSCQCEIAKRTLPRRPDEGPLAYAQRAATRWPQWSELLRRIGATYALLRYGPRDARHGERLGTLRQSVAALPGARALRGTTHT